MAEKWVETTVRDLTEWADRRGGVDVHGAKILLELADLNETGELTPELLRELLVEDFTEAVSAGPDDAPAVLATAGVLIDYFADTEALDDARIAELRTELTAVAPDFIGALIEADADAGEAVEFLARMMHADGVDLDDESAVETWVREFEALPEEEKAARTAQQIEEENVVPPVRLLPQAELADLARASGLLKEALALVAWTGERTLEDERLTDEDVQAAAEALGTPTPRAADGEIPEIDRLWDAVVDADLIDTEDGTAAPAETPDLGDDEEVLDLFLDVFDGIVTREHEEGERLSPLEVVQGELPGVLLHLYEHGGVTPVEDLVEELLEHIEETYDIADQDVLDQAGPQALAFELADLERWGAVALTEDGCALTPLGTWAVRELLQADGYRAPLIGDLAEGTAEELVVGLAWHREDTADEEIELWLARRSAGDAAHGLLDIVRNGRPAARNLASVVLQQVGAEADAIIRASLTESHARPYAALWLREHGDLSVDVTEADMRWMFVDTVAGMLDALGPEDAVMMAVEDAPDGDALTGLIDHAWRTGHPDVADVLEAIGEHHPDKNVAKAARKAAFKARSK